MGFTLIRHRLRRRHLPPLGGRLIGAPFRYYSDVGRLPLSEPSPLAGEGGWPQARRMRGKNAEQGRPLAAPAPCAIINKSKLTQVSSRTISASAAANFAWLSRVRCMKSM